MNVEGCLLEGLLKKTAPDFEKARVSLEKAEHKLEIAEQEFDSGIYESAVISAYTSLFHSGRALLFKDGYKERSHYAIAIYLEEKYGGKLERKYLTEFNSLRLQRHDLMYSLEETEEINEVEAESAIAVAKGFLEAVKKLI